MARFFVQKENVKKNVATVVGSDVKHIRRVYRLGVGDRVVLFDGTGCEYHAEIISANSKELTVNILESFLPQRESPIETVLGQGLPKLPKMDMIVQKGTELGVSEILPFYSHRSIPNLTGDRLSRRVERWRKIALESSKQCGRDRIPNVGTPIDFAEILSVKLQNSLKIILWEGESATGLKGTFDANPDKTKFIILIGPEGGFTNSEILKAEEAGFNVVSMGDRILRSETASISILSVIQYRFGDLN